MSNYILHSDGGARGNPGPAAVGFLLYDADMQQVDQGSEYLGTATNNFAEYRALISGLKLAVSHDISELECRLDSELVVKQLNGQYKVKHPDIKKLYAEVQELLPKFSKVAFKHVRREENAEADRLVNEKLDSL